MGILSSRGLEDGECEAGGLQEGIALRVAARWTWEGHIVSSPPTDFIGYLISTPDKSTKIVSNPRSLLSLESSVQDSFIQIRLTQTRPYNCTRIAGELSGE